MTSAQMRRRLGHEDRAPLRGRPAELDARL